MGNEIEFWFRPTTGTVVWFFVWTVSLIVLAIALRVLFLRFQKQRQENEFQEVLIKHELLGKPEETVLRGLIERYKISPPVTALANLSAYDQIASEEIHRTEREPIPLSERVDRIEYLYSIRYRAFAQEVSVGGIRSLVPQHDLGGAAAPVFEPPERPSGPPHESEGEPGSLVEPDEFVEGLGLVEEDDAMARLLGTPDTARSTAAADGGSKE